MAKDLYQVLEITPAATQAEIKSAYRKLARKYHPDVNKDDKSAAEKFRAISSAYEILGTPEKRAKYDRDEINSAGESTRFGGGGFGSGFNRRGGGVNGKWDEASSMNVRYTETTEEEPKPKTSFKDKIRSFLRFLTYVMPVVLVVFGIYAFYLKIVQNRVIDTQKDLMTFTKNVSTRYNQTIYKNFDTDFISYSEYLPIDLKIKKTDHGNEVVSRFGGKMIFKESPKTVEERDWYKFIIREKQRFEAHYNGLGAYTVLFTELRKQECVSLATTDWQKIIPNFMGLEASAVSDTHPYNGIENLHYYILAKDKDGNEYNEKPKGRDEGVISRGPMDTLEALKACSCFGSSCQVALKFE